MAPAAHTSQTPTNTGFDNGAAITRGVGFYVTANLTVSGIYMWIPSTNTGTYTCGLWQTLTDDDPDGTGTGSLLENGSISSAGVTAGQWDVVPLDAPVDLTTGVLYRAGVHATSGWFASTPSVMGTPISGNNVVLYASGDDPFGGGTVRNGCFNVSGSLAYPANAFSATDYFIDVELDDGASVIPVGTATETDTAFAFGRRKSRAVGLASETDTAIALARTKRRALSTAPSTEVALPIGRLKVRALGVVTETNSAFALARTKRRTVGLATETDVALAITLPGVADVKGSSTPAVTTDQTSNPVVTAGRTSTPAVSARRTSLTTVG